MKHTLSHPVTALIGLMLLGATAAQAATTTYTFSGTLDSGMFNGEPFSGQFSFDDAALIKTGNEYIAVDAVSLSFLGHDYTLSDAAATPEAAFADGAFLGLGYIVESSDPAFSLIPAEPNVSEAYFGYTPSAGVSGFGSVTYTLVPVPEPETYGMVLAGLGLVAWAAKRNRALMKSGKPA